MSPLAALPHLSSLFLGLVKGLSRLPPLPRLEKLEVYGMPENDLSNLAALGNLTALTLRTRDLSAPRALDPLARLLQLRSLVIQSSDVTDLGFVTGLTHLNELDLTDNQITTLAPLEANQGLGAGTKVDLGGNPIDCFREQPRLDRLRARGVQINTGCP